MTDAHLLADLINRSAARNADAIALTYGKQSISYGAMQQAIAGFVGGLLSLGLQRGERVAIYLEKRPETVVASFGATAAGCVFVPLNPLLKAEQVAYIMRDCNVRALVTSSERLALLEPILPACHDLRHVVVTNAEALPAAGGPLAWLRWNDLLQAGTQSGHRVIDSDMAAILYTSGSTGKPKGVVLSHRNMVAGAKSVASYLENTADDTLLAALPLSFDAGFSQLTTAF
ncbi:MAG: AMP-binding protein, partial [Candidatus Accumulibacter sp.]|nr:AMP-binding protein [Accumulibacter sp.]